MIHYSTERECLLCKTIVKRRKSVTLSLFPEEDGFVWCSNKCMMIWLFISKVTQDGEEITEITDNKTGEGYSISDIKPEDIQPYV